MKRQPARRSNALFSLLLALVTAEGGRGQLFDPREEWLTIETEHFLVHFPTGSEEGAGLVATLAERAHQRLVPVLGWAPRGKTEVVLTDQIDFANGFATPYPYNLMGLFVTPPLHGGFLEVEDLEQWLEVLIEHEYTHVLHLDRAAGGPLALRRVFGRHLFTFPNALQPIWGIEGLATHLEGHDVAGAGRGQAAEFAMVMRTEVLAGVRPLAQVHVPNVTWPAGVVPYLYGQHFYHYLEQAYGPKAIGRLVEAYSGNLLPFRVGGTFRRVFGVTLGELWQGFEAHLEELYGGQLAAIQAAGVVEGEALTEGGFAGRERGGHSVAGLPDGSVFFLRDDGSRQPELLRRGPDGELERLARVRRGARLDAHATAGVVVAQPEVCREYGVFYDLYHLPAEGGRLRRLTRCSRYLAAAWAPDGSALAAVRMDLGRTDLLLLDSEGRPLRVLAEGREGELFSHPQVSPDGARALVVRSRRGEGADLWELELATGRWQRLTDDLHVPIHPRYSHDGEAILFASDHGGVYDLRRLRLASGEVETLTRTLTGALHPAEGADGEVYYLRHGPLGFDLHRLSAGAPALATSAAAPRHPPREPAPPTELAARRYSPLATLRPRLWGPVLELGTDLSRVGAWTHGVDALRHHEYALELSVDIDRGVPLGSASYRWADRLFVSTSRTHEVHRVAREGQGGQILRWEEAQAAWRLSHTRLDSRWSLYLGGAFDRAALVIDDAPDRGLLRDQVAGGVLVYSDARRPRLAVSAQEGRTLRLAVESSVGGDDFSGEVFTLDWREHRHLGANHVLALRGVAGWGTDLPRPFVLGGVRSAGLGLFNQRRYGLRGYAEGHPALRGRRMQLFSAEYRFPLRRVERGLTAPPLGLVQWSGSAFVEAGAAWDAQRPGRLHPAAGVEAVLDAVAGYHLTGRVRAGYARGFDRDAGGDDRFYLLTGASF